VPGVLAVKLDSALMLIIIWPQQGDVEIRIGEHGLHDLGWP
jgi:hypothetical protein